MEQETIIIVSVFGCAWALLLILVVVLFTQVVSLRRLVNHMQATGRIRVQKLRMNNDKNHAFHNPGLVPDEELSKRGFSMYAADNGDRDVESGRARERYDYVAFQAAVYAADDGDRDVESGRARERQTGGLTEDLVREIESRQQRQNMAPPFLLASIEENKRLRTNVPNGRQSDTNPNFIY